METTKPQVSTTNEATVTLPIRVIKWEASMTRYEFYLIKDGARVLLLDTKNAWSALVEAHLLFVDRAWNREQMTETISIQESFAWSAVDAKNIVDACFWAVTQPIAYQLNGCHETLEENFIEACEYADLRDFRGV